MELLAMIVLVVLIAECITQIQLRHQQILKMQSEETNDTDDTNP